MVAIDKTNRNNCKCPAHFRMTLWKHIRTGLNLAIGIGWERSQQNKDQIQKLVDQAESCGGNKWIMYPMAGVPEPRPTLLGCGSFGTGLCKWQVSMHVCSSICVTCRCLNSQLHLHEWCVCPHLHKWELCVFTPVPVTNTELSPPPPVRQAGKFGERCPMGLLECFLMIHTQVFTFLIIWPRAQSRNRLY